MNTQQIKKGSMNMFVKQRIVFVTSVPYVAGEKLKRGLLSNTSNSVNRYCEKCRTFLKNKEKVKML